MTVRPTFTRRRGFSAEHPVELRFVDMLLIIIATLVFIAVVLSVTSTFTSSRTNGKTFQGLQVITTSAPPAIAGASYVLALSARGGDGIYTWKRVDGSLPDGMTMSPQGVVQGTPTRRQQENEVTVQVADGTGATAQSVLTFSVRPAGAGKVLPPLPQVRVPVALFAAVVGQPSTYTIQAGAGQSPFTWHVDGTLPSGLHVSDDVDGQFHFAGQPTQAGNFTFTVVMRDGDGKTAEQQVKMVIQNPPSSLFWRILGWLRLIIDCIGYLLIAMLIWFWAKGTPPTQGGWVPPNPGKPPIWDGDRWGWGTGRKNGTGSRNDAAHWREGY